jgi:hypothetical protein
MYGLESEFLDYSSADMTEKMWSTGFRMVTEDPHLAANAGESSYGSAVFLEFSWNLTEQAYSR